MPFDRNFPPLAVSFVAAFMLLTLVLPASAQETAGDDGGWIATLQFENDIFGNTDQHFSHGMRAALMTPENSVPEWIRDLAAEFPLFNAEHSRRAVFSLGQNTYTPTDLVTPALQIDDRPYAGWLYGGIGLVSVDPDGTRLDNIELNIGVVGPASFADEVQTLWHRWFGFQHPYGWGNQLKNEPGIVLTYERAWRHAGPAGFLGLDWGMTPHAGISLGNVLTQAAGGVTFRIGEDLQKNLDYGPPRIRPSLPGSDYFKRGGRLSWYFFLGAEGRAVGRNIFLDGNSFVDSHNVDKKYFVGDIQAGIAIIMGSVRVAYTHVYRTPEFDGQDAGDVFGAFSVSMMF